MAKTGVAWLSEPGKTRVGDPGYGKLYHYDAKREGYCVESVPLYAGRQISPNFYIFIGAPLAVAEVGIEYDKCNGTRSWIQEVLRDATLFASLLMLSHESSQRRHSAVEEFNRREQRQDGAQVAERWCEGLTTLRNLMCVRLREDVEENFGLDSLQLPTSAIETERRLEQEIAIYQAAVSTVHAREKKYVAGDAAWLAEWLVNLQNDQAALSAESRSTLEHYLSLTRQEQRHLFTNTAMQILPATSRAPLVLFRLFPVGVRIVTAMALGDADGASELRIQQRAILPSIDDCPQCHAAVLPNGHVCSLCSNPLWGYRFLTAAD